MTNIVSEAAQIREMDAGELEREWYRLSQEHKNKIRYATYSKQILEHYQELYHTISLNYFQLTGKTLN